MERFLDYVLRNLIEYPEEMAIFTEVTGNKTVFRLRLRQTDIGRVVGKGGTTILAIRNLLDAAAAKHGGRATVEIIEDQQRDHRDTPREQPAPRAET